MSFWKGFISIFNLFPEPRIKSYMEIKQEIDEKLSRLGIDLYHPMMYTVHEEHTCSFTPYSYYNENLDKISVYFKDEDYYVQSLNNNMELCINFETKEVIGLHFLNVKQLAKKYEHTTK